MKKSVFKSRYYWAIVIAAVAALIWLLWGNKGGALKEFKHEGVVWTTEYHITYTAPVDLNDSIQEILRQIDASASVYNKTSAVTRWNASEGGGEVDRFIAMLYTAASDVYRRSEGAYDPTVMPLVNAWGFGYKSGKLPDRAQLDSILTFVGLNKTKLDGTTLSKSDPRVQLDFSSIAKGMACDEIVRMLVRNGASSAMVEIGGEVACHGSNARGEAWTVSIDLPVEEDEGDDVQHNSAAIVRLDGNMHGVATSGSYRKWKESNGKKLSHIVDPKTGSADESNLLSVTIIAPDCMTADAWATACMAMGVERTQQMMKENNTLGVMTIHVDDQKRLVVWTNKTFTDRQP